MPESILHHVDTILLTLGPTGKYQILQTLVTFLAMFPVAFQLLSNVFISRSVPHQCAAPIDEVDLRKLLNENLSNQSVTYDECEITVWSNGTVVKRSSCLFGVQYKLPIQTSAVSQFDLVCERSSLARLSQALVIAGQGVGAFITTIVSDRFGRKKVLVACNFAVLATGLIAAYSPNYFVFAVSKFVIGALQQGVVTSMATFTLELVPARQRRLNSSAFGLIWSTSTMLMAFIAFLFREHSWRTLQMVFSVSSVFAFLQWWYLDESLRWLIANGRYEQACTVISRAARMNKRHVDGIQITNRIRHCTVSHEISDSCGQNLISNVSSTLGATKKLSMLDLLRVGSLLRSSLFMWFAWFTTSLGFFVLYLTSTSLSGDRFLNFFLTALMELPATFILFFSINRFGRKSTAMGFYAMLGLGLVAAGIFKHLKSQSGIYSGLILASSLLAMLGGSGSFNVVFMYTPEMYPTNLRSQAMGVASFVGRLGGMLAPFTGVLAEKAIWAPGLLIGCFACIVCVLFIFLPETNGRELPQTIEDFHQWFKTGDKEHEIDEKTQDSVSPDNGVPTSNGIPKSNAVPASSGFPMNISVSACKGISTSNGDPVSNGIPPNNGIPMSNGLSIQQ